jgi:prepilin-type N-terminal cleavage/methylation domain-containing protein
VYVIFKMLKKLFSKNLPGFTMIELAIVLMVMGIIAGAVFKGQDLLEAAKIRAVLNDFNRFKSAITHYQETYSALPGDDPNASNHFGTDVVGGNGDGIVSGDSEEKAFWVHLFKAGYLSSDKAPSSKFGGRYSVVSNPAERMSGNWLQLGKENGSKANGGLFTPRQAQMLKSKAEDGGSSIGPSEGTLRVIEGSGIPAGQCIQGGRFNLSVSTPVCVVLCSF